MLPLMPQLPLLYLLLQLPPASVCPVAPRGEPLLVEHVRLVAPSETSLLAVPVWPMASSGASLPATHVWLDLTSPGGNEGKGEASLLATHV
eukprot:1144677-Pelagomonas_calceolata.AAC.6